MPRYFKLVCLADDPEWLVNEFREGRARFGWSPEGTDLRQIKQKIAADRTPAEIDTWGHSKFLIERLNVGDRVVVQPEKPIRRFLVGEVVAPGYMVWNDRGDFNHGLSVEPLVKEPIPINANVVSLALKHDLSKRGYYYEVYPERSILELNRLVGDAQGGQLNLNGIREHSDTLAGTRSAIMTATIDHIRSEWPAQGFEQFCEWLCNSLDYVEVKERVDRRLGWDLLVRFINPITNAVLLEDIPVQCKNYRGEVVDKGPIDDLERCIRHSGTNLALLFILGDLTPDFRSMLQQREATLSAELNRRIAFEVIDQERIAELYWGVAAA